MKLSNKIILLLLVTVTQLLLFQNCSNSFKPKDISELQKSQSSSVATQFLLEPSDQFLYVGDYLSLAPQISDTTNIELQWFKDDLPLLGQNKLSLIITNIQLIDTGSYKLVITQSSQQIESRVIAVKVSPKPSTNIAPLWQKVLPATLIVTEGEPISLEVQATGYPTPNYSWEKDGAHVQGVANQLLIAQAQLGDSGTYSVRASNIEGWTMLSTVSVSVHMIKLGFQYVRHK